MQPQFKILKAVSLAFNIPICELIFSRKQTSNLGFARHFLDYFLSVNLNWTLQKIAKFRFKKDHTTVIYSIKTIEFSINPKYNDLKSIEYYYLIQNILNDNNNFILPKQEKTFTRNELIDFTRRAFVCDNNTIYSDSSINQLIDNFFDITRERGSDVRYYSN